MKKQLLYFFLGLFLINSVLALDCQYTEFKQNEKQRTEYYLNGEVADIKPPFVNVTDIWDGKLTLGTTRNYKITLKSYVAEQLNITLRYNAEGKQREHALTIDPLASIFIEGSYSQDLLFFDSASIRINIDNIEQKEISYFESIEVCKMCGNQICLNDEVSCNPLYDSSKCGSGICNIAGFCGHQKVVDCPNGKLNCQDKICLESSTKEQGESYMCSFECKSDRFENGTCLKSSEQIKIDKGDFWMRIIIFGVIILLISLAGYWKFKKGGADKEEERIKKAKKEFDEIVVKKEDAEKAIKNINQNLEELKEEKKEIEKNLVEEKEKSKKKIGEIRIKEKEEIEKWEIKKKNKSVEAQKAIDEEIENIRRKRKKEIEATEKELEERQNNLNTQIDEIKKLSLEEENNKKKIEESKKLMNEFHLNKQGYSVRLNEKGYEILKDGTLFHIFWYCKNSNEKQKDLHGFNIHHIDGDKWNNDYSNLIKIEEYTHNDIHLHNIRWIGYRKGVEVLKKYSSIEIPERVINELQRIERIGKKYPARWHRK